MNKTKKPIKIIKAFISIFLILMLLTSNPITINSDTGLIYQKSTKQPVAAGVTYEKITRFTTAGWLEINVMRADLTNPYISVDTLISSESVKTLEKVKTMAQEKGAVAAINGGFFNWLPGANSGYPDGPVVQSGQVINASSEFNRYNDSMATFSINNLNQMFFKYWKTEITLTTQNGNIIPITQFNKPSLDYNDYTVLDKKWGESSLGVSENYPDLIEIVIDGGRVTEIRESQPSVKIPRNGYIVITRSGADGENIKAVKDNFKVGSALGLKFTTNPDWSSIKLAISGSAILVDNGRIPEKFSFNIDGKHPRTAVGSTSDGKELIMVTVDGRQKGSMGMTQTELALLMMELGAFNAINFDGGGSTTMVGRTLGSNNLGILNSPSEGDGSGRSVSTALGVFSSAPASTLGGLVIETTDKNIFIDTSRDFTVRGYDAFYNPVAINPEQITWSASGVDGMFVGSTFYPKTAGAAKIKASIGEISSEISVNVLGAPAQISLNESSAILSVNQSRTFSVKGKSIDGFTAQINPLDVKWEVNGVIGYFNQQIFNATVTGIGYIDASIGNAHAYCAVTVAVDKVIIKDRFEVADASFSCYPTGQKGGYEISSEQKQSGMYSGKLSYDFTNLEGTRAAYMVYPGEGLTLEPASSKLGLWVYNNHNNSNWLRAEIIDTNGKKHTVDFTKNMDWNGWKYLEASLKGIPSPGRLTRIYLVQVSPVSDSGYIYMDDLSLTMLTGNSGSIELPKATIPPDPDNISTAFEKKDSQSAFIVYGQLGKPKNLLENMMRNKLMNLSSSFDTYAAIGNESSIEAKNSVGNKPFISSGSGYKSFDIKENRFIQLDSSKKSIRATDPVQWSWFLKQLDSQQSKNIFIFLENSPDSFSDNLEANLFRSILTELKLKTGKNIWVFSKGKENSAIMYEGVKYITTSGFDIKALSPNNMDKVKYIVVTIKDGKPTYEFKSVY